MMQVATKCVCDVTCCFLSQGNLSKYNLHQCNTRVGIVISQAWAPRKQALSAGILIVDVEHGDVNRGRPECMRPGHPELAPSAQETGRDKAKNRQQSIANPTGNA